MCIRDSLRTLEEDGFVLRDARPVVPPHVEYSLTADGERLADLVLSLMSFVADRTDDSRAG